VQGLFTNELFILNNFKLDKSVLFFFSSIRLSSIIALLIISNLCDNSPALGVNEILSVDTFISTSSNKLKRGDMIVFKFSERAGASTEPPLSVPIPKILISKYTFKVVLLDEPVMCRVVNGCYRKESIALPCGIDLSIV